LVFSFAFLRLFPVAFVFISIESMLCKLHGRDYTLHN